MFGVVLIVILIVLLIFNIFDYFQPDFFCQFFGHGVLAPAVFTFIFVDAFVIPPVVVFVGDDAEVVGLMYESGDRDSIEFSEFDEFFEC